MMQSLNAICEGLRDQIHSEYDLGHGDAEELFKLIWAAMTSGPNSQRIQSAVDLVEETFGI